jgi:hypothetical protein
MKSEIFYTNIYKEIQSKIIDFLNKYRDFLSLDTISSPRATGDAIQHILEENFESILGNQFQDYSARFARRAMADLAFRDKNDFYYIVDVKTHRLETKFNMPNLTSVERLARFYEDDKNYYVVLMIAYNVGPGVRIQIERAHFVPIEFFSWDCLTVGALGWGQIQIANANRTIINQGYSRKDWMLELCNVLFEFYPNEIEKVKGRIEYFKKVKSRWEDKKDIWK